ncbi:MAG TPA: zf-HC2 domain-containing protein [Kofleriaceae bacterium]|nr:zf-HC2 domain-containing protein [Kofleriaceae bacterium]
MTCDDTRRRLTAYLDGDLDADGGTLVRVHLRGCAACRQVATEEAELRDELRALPVLDPPPALWAGVQARLAAAEEAAARRPWWRRALARWTPALPRFAAGGLVAAAAVTALWWRTHRAGEPGIGPGTGPGTGPEPVLEVIVHPTPEIKASPGPAPVARPASCEIPEAADATADLALDDARRSGCYAATAAALVAELEAPRAEWTADQRAAFDDQHAALRQAVAAAREGRPRHRAWRAVVRYLQGALARDEVVALASGGAP